MATPAVPIPASPTGTANVAGRQILVVATMAPGDMLEQTAEDGQGDLVSVEVANNSGTDDLATLCLGGTDPKDQITMLILKQAGPVKILTDRPWKRGQSITIFAGTTNVLVAFCRKKPIPS
jgi:hypothetical protein